MQLYQILSYLSVSLATVQPYRADDQPYCSARYRRLCQGKGRHVACQFPDPGPGESCENYTQIKFDSELRQYVTHYINRRRQRIAAGHERVRGGAHIPKPTVMMMVEWDRELALLAQRLADQCSFIHDECRATVRFPYAGQTVGEVRWRRTSASESASAQRAVRRVLDAWWGERRRVEARQITQPFRLTQRGLQWGHFSQLAVWSLRGVGCGAARHDADSPRLLLVCDYSHTNMLGERTLTPGPRAACPRHSARRRHSPYPLLCGPIRQKIDPREDTAPNPVPVYRDYDEDDDYDVADSEPDTVTRPTTHYNRNGDDDDLITLTLRRTQPRDRKDRVDHEIDMGRFEHVRVEHLLNQERERPKKMKRPSSAEEDDEERARVTHYKPALDRVTTTSTHVRRKWQQTRDRPRRPGADALMSPPEHDFSPLIEQTSREAAVTLSLDKDDVEQLFQDTGFRIGWRAEAT